MQSNNPIFSRSEEFQRGGANIYGGQPGAPASDPSQWSVGTPGGTGYAPAQTQTGPMTIDSVVQKTAITLGVVIVAAMATWILTPTVTEDTAANVDLGPLFAAVTIGSLGAFALSMVNSFKRVISPPLVLAFAALEGVALGAISKLFNMQFEGVVTGAVLGTFGAFAGTLAAYKFFNIQVGARFRTFVIAAVFGISASSKADCVKVAAPTGSRSSTSRGSSPRASGSPSCAIRRRDSSRWACSSRTISTTARLRAPVSSPASASSRGGRSSSSRTTRR